jgi:hypothetical protein
LIRRWWFVFVCLMVFNATFNNISVIDLCNQCLLPLILWVWISIRARCTKLCDTVCQWLATGQWFSPGCVQHDFHIRWHLCHLTLTQPVPMVEQELFTLPEHLSKLCDKFCQWHSAGRWFSPGTPASFTTKTGRHDIAEILLKVALKHQKSNIRFTPVQVKINNDDTLLHNWLWSI